MNSWQKSLLGKIGTLERGKGLQKDDFTESGVPCIHYGQIFTHYSGFTDKTISHVSPETAKNCTTVQKGDVVLAMTSENVQDLCKSTVWLGNTDIVTGGHSGIFRHNQSPKYLGYYFQSEYFNRQKAKYAKGTKVIEINPEDILNRIKIKLPDLETQQKIVQILDMINAEIALIKNLILLEKKTFSGLLQIISKIPNSSLCQLGGIAMIKKGVQLNKENLLTHGIPVINGGIEPSGFTSDSNTEANAITISEGGNSCGFVNFQIEPFWLGGHCYTITPNEINKKLLYFILKGNERRIKRLRVGSGLPNIQKEDLKKIKISIPPFNKHENIVALLGTVENRINALNKLIKKEQAIYKYLLNHLISGDLDVSNIKLEKGKEQK